MIGCRSLLSGKDLTTTERGNVMNVRKGRCIIGSKSMVLFEFGMWFCRWGTFVDAGSGEGTWSEPERIYFVHFLSLYRGRIIDIRRNEFVKRMQSLRFSPIYNGVYTVVIPKPKGCVKVFYESCRCYVP